MMRKLFIVICASLCASAAFAQTARLLFSKPGNKFEVKTATLEKISDDTLRLRIPMSEIGADVNSVEILPDFARAKVGDAGYFISSYGEMTYFNDRPKKVCWCEHPKNIMPIFGSKTPSGTYLGVVRSMKYSHIYRAEKKDENYSLKAVFKFANNPAYEDIVIDYIKLEDSADYSDMARRYRKIRYDEDGLKPLKEKIKTRPELAYALDSIEARVMHGLKVVKGPIEDQTPENEPPMEVLSTFPEAGELFDAMKKIGIEKMQVCLVGWNMRGHDGRYPQQFPVEEGLGGEPALRSLIKSGQGLGYQMVCHTNFTDAYRIAECWDDEYIAKNPDGTLSKNSKWSGGRMYNLCLKRSYELFAEKNISRIADLGFHGLLYIDVMTAIYPFRCFDPRHPMTPAEGVEYSKKIFQIARDKIGGVLSEFGIEHSFDVCDGTINVFPQPSYMKDNTGIVDRIVPFWEIVYHGTVIYSLQSPYRNPADGNPSIRLKLAEFGGRPRFDLSFPLHSMSPDARAKLFAEKLPPIKAGHDAYRKLSHLQLEFMQSHSEIAPNVFKTQYSDGTEIVCNYSKVPFEYRAAKIAPLDFAVLAPAK